MEPDFFDMFDLFNTIASAETSVDSDSFFEDADAADCITQDSFNELIGVADNSIDDCFDLEATDNDNNANDFTQESFNELIGVADESINNYFDWVITDSTSASDENTQLVQDNIERFNQPDSSNTSWLSDAFDYVIRVYDDFYYKFLKGSDDIVTEHHFSNDGSFDVKNNVITEGNVVHDMQFTQEQTHNSCSLMAQEQFVHRYIGRAIPEDYLEWAAEKWGVYSPDIGTIEDGHTMVLEHFKIPYEKYSNMDIQDLSNAISNNKDIIIGVDAREFYGNPSIPPGSGHAVAVIGQGVNPTTHEVEGFYVTDSNFPESAHFISVEKMESSWWNDMITIPEYTV